VTVSPGPQVPPPALPMKSDDPGNCHCAGLANVDSGVYRPEARAAEATTSLKVEPGGFSVPAIARFDSGRSGSASSAS